MTTHCKLETARIIGQIQKSYSNLNEVLTPIQTKEEFEKSLKENEILYEEKIISNYIQEISKSLDGKSKEECGDILEKAKQELLSLKKHRVAIGNTIKNVFVKELSEEELKDKEIKS